VVEREWREASDMRRSTLPLLGVLIAAALLRFWSLGAGIPTAVGVDEPQIVDRAVQMMKTGSLNPKGFFDYPSLYLYIQMAVACVRFLAGAMTGEFKSLNAARPEDFYLWGRAVTATLGTLTVFLLYRIGLRWGTRYALLASALLAVAPLHVRESHYVLTDVPLTFFVALTFLLSLAAHEKPTALAFAKAGAAAGLAAAIKYPGALAITLPLVCVWMTPDTRPSRLTGALSAIAAAAFLFLLAAPYTVLDLPGFLDGYAKLATAYSDGRLSEPAWLTYLKHLRINLRWPAVLLIAAGLVLAMVRSVRGPGRVRWTLAIAFPIVYFWFISRQTLIFGRYVLPIVPFLCLLAAVAVVAGVSLLRRFAIPRAVRTALIAGLTVAALLPPLMRSIGFVKMIGHQATVELAYNWIQHNLPKGAKIVVETRGVHVPPGYNSTNLSQLRQREFAEYRSSGVEYLIASSDAFGRYMEAPQNAPREYEQYMRIFGQAHEVARFSPSNEHPGPELRILKVQP
jgi:4-amino-4-deoxy-L-arabinose transferase-like glycosyltransferase